MRSNLAKKEAKSNPTQAEIQRILAENQKLKEENSMLKEKNRSLSDEARECRKKTLEVQRELIDRMMSEVRVNNQVIEEANRRIYSGTSVMYVNK
jgi:predicted nuclease with TOPRIM domain